MPLSLKVLGPFLALLFPLCGFLIHSQSFSWREFMKQHHLSSNWEFDKYRCNDLMRDKKAPKGNYHIFIYAFWRRIEHICNRNWRDRYRNVYIWTQYPFKILKCYQQGKKNIYRESRSYSYIEFHCGMSGYVDSIEDTRLFKSIRK